MDNNYLRYVGKRPTDDAESYRQLFDASQLGLIAQEVTKRIKELSRGELLVTVPAQRISEVISTLAEKEAASHVGDIHSRHIILAGAQQIKSLRDRAVDIIVTQIWNEYSHHQHNKANFLRWDTIFTGELHKDKLRYHEEIYAIKKRDICRGNFNMMY